jgi:hypothetical protein
VRGSERPWFVAAFVGLFALAVYARTLHPSVPGGDAGELILAAARLEVAHPPGYPLYTLLAKAATLLPVGSVAWRVNLLSAVCAAAAAAVIAATVTTAAASALAGAVAGLLFAFSPLVWTHATGAEVFPLHALLVALLCWWTLRWRRTGAFRDAVAIAAVIGLGLSHHHTIVFYAAPILVWICWLDRRKPNALRRLAALAGAVASGLAWYLYLPLAARTATTLSWGDPTTLQGFLDHLLRRDYGTFQLAADVDPAASHFADRLAAWALHTHEATAHGAAFVLIGALGCLGLFHRDEARDRAWIGLWVVSLAIYVLGFNALANLPVGDPVFRAVTARFWHQSDVAVFVLLGLGLGAVLGGIPRPLRRVLAAACIVVVAIVLGSGFAAHDHRRDDTVARFGHALLEPLPPDTLLLTRGDLVTNATRYLATCDGVRTDVVILDQELLTKPWYVERAAREHPDLRFPGVVYDPARADGFSMRAFLDANAGTRPVAVYPDWKPGDASTDGVYELTPRGLALDVARIGTAPSVEERRDAGIHALATLDDYGWQRLGLYAPGTWERVAREDVWQAQHRFGWWLLTEALAPDADPRLFASARIYLERAEASHPDPPSYVFRNLGIVYERLALKDPRLRTRQLEAWRRYLATAPADDEGRSAIAATVARLEAAPPDPTTR